MPRSEGSYYSIAAILHCMLAYIISSPHKHQIPQHRQGLGLLRIRSTTVVCGVLQENSVHLGYFEMRDVWM
ncbi:hypothetical protein BDW69DRAFT_178600 [Aspergillus filifer]